MAASAAAAAAIAIAIKASGVLIRVRPEEFEKILRKTERPLIIHSQGGLFSTKYQYLTSYKGFAFYTKAPIALQLPLGAELVLANKVWMP